MSASQVPIQPLKRGSVGKLALGILLLIVAALLLAWAGAGRIDALQLRTLAAGSGTGIKKGDGVLMEYTGRLPGGKVFDSTNGRGPLPLIVGQSIPGFDEALLKMHEGGRYTVHIPAKLAYGEASPEGIPANSPLDFDVHIVKVVDSTIVAQAQAQQRMMQMQMQQQGQAPPPPQ